MKNLHCRIYSGRYIQHAGWSQIECWIRITGIYTNAWIERMFFWCLKMNTLNEVWISPNIGMFGEQWESDNLWTLVLVPLKHSWDEGSQLGSSLTLIVPWMSLLLSDRRVVLSPQLHHKNMQFGRYCNSPDCGSTDTVLLFLDFWWCLPWVGWNPMYLFIYENDDVTLKDISSNNWQSGVNIVALVNRFSTLSMKCQTANFCILVSKGISCIDEILFTNSPFKD